MRIRDFSGGINKRLDPTLIAQNEAQELINADISSGALCAAKGSKIVDPVPEGFDGQNHEYAYFHKGKGYFSANKRSYVAFRDKVYFSQDELGGKPQIYLDSGMPRDLGIPPITDEQAAQVQLEAIAVRSNWSPSLVEIEGGYDNIVRTGFNLADVNKPAGSGNIAASREIDSAASAGHQEKYYAVLKYRDGKGIGKTIRSIRLKFVQYHTTKRRPKWYRSHVTYHHYQRKEVNIGSCLCSDFTLTVGVNSATTWQRLHIFAQLNESRDWYVLRRQGNDFILGDNPVKQSGALVEGDTNSGVIKVINQLPSFSSTGPVVFYRQTHSQASTRQKYFNLEGLVNNERTHVYNFDLDKSNKLQFIVFDVATGYSFNLYRRENAGSNNNKKIITFPNSIEPNRELLSMSATIADTYADTDGDVVNLSQSQNPSVVPSDAQYAITNVNEDLYIESIPKLINKILPGNGAVKLTNLDHSSPNGTTHKYIYRVDNTRPVFTYIGKLDVNATFNKQPPPDSNDWMLDTDFPWTQLAPPAHSQTAAYAVGALTTSNGKLYSAIAQVSAPTNTFAAVSADDINLGVGNWEGATATATRLYFVDDTTNYARAYDHSGNRQAADDIDLGGGIWEGTLATATRLYFIDDIAAYARAYDHTGAPQSADDINLGTGGWSGGLATATRLYFIDTIAAVARAYDHNKNRQAADDINLGLGNWEGATATATRLYFIDTAAGYARAYDHSGNRQATDDIDLGVGAWRGGLATATRLYFVDDIANYARAYAPTANPLPENDSTRWSEIITTAWSGATAYNQNDVVTNEGNYFKANADIAIDANPNPSPPAWSISSAYSRDDRVTYVDNAMVYKALKDIASDEVLPLTEFQDNYSGSTQGVYIYYPLETRVSQAFIDATIDTFRNSYPLEASLTKKTTQAGAISIARLDGQELDQENASARERGYKNYWDGIHFVPPNGFTLSPPTEGDYARINVKLSVSSSTSGTDTFTTYKAQYNKDNIEIIKEEQVLGSALGQTITSLRNYEPENMQYLTLYNNIFFGVGITDEIRPGENVNTDNILYFSRIGRPHYWPKENFIEFENPIQGLLEVHQGLLIFTEFKTYLLQGSSAETFQIAVVSEEYGMVPNGHATGSFARSIPLWITQDGIASYYNGRVEIISRDKLADRYPWTEVINCEFCDDQYFILFQDGTILCYDLRYNARFIEYDLSIPVQDEGSTQKSSPGWLTNYNGCLGYIQEPTVDQGPNTFRIAFEGEGKLNMTYKGPTFTEGSPATLKNYSFYYISKTGQVRISLEKDTVTDTQTQLIPECNIENQNKLAIPGGKSRAYSITPTFTGEGCVREFYLEPTRETQKDR